MTGPPIDADRQPDHPEHQPVADTLLDVLGESQRLGFLGERSVVEAAAHSRAFVRALSGVSGVVVDMGSGGGLPGLVIGHDRTDLELVLVDRRAKRTDFLQRVVKRLGWSDRISVLEADVQQVIARRGDAFDAVVARGFGPPDRTLRMAADLLAPRGRIVISEPPDGNRWEPELLQELDLVRIDDRSDSVSVFERVDPLDVSRGT